MYICVCIHTYTYMITYTYIHIHNNLYLALLNNITVIQTRAFSDDKGKVKENFSLTF